MKNRTVWNIIFFVLMKILGAPAFDHVCSKGERRAEKPIRGTLFASSFLRIFIVSRTKGISVFGVRDDQFVDRRLAPDRFAEDRALLCRKTQDASPSPRQG